MAGIEGKADLTRLEDFIQLGKQGKKISAEISLTTQVVRQKLPVGESMVGGEEVDMHLLMGNFAFTVEGQASPITISKVYMFGSVVDSASDSAKTHRVIANARLDMDYRRLRQGRVQFQEQYFQ